MRRCAGSWKRAKRSVAQNCEMYHQNKINMDSNLLQMKRYLYQLGGSFKIASVIRSVPQHGVSFSCAASLGRLLVSFPKGHSSRSRIYLGFIASKYLDGSHRLQLNLQSVRDFYGQSSDWMKLRRRLVDKTARQGRYNFNLTKAVNSFKNTCSDNLSLWTQTDLLDERSCFNQQRHNLRFL